MRMGHAWRPSCGRLGNRRSSPSPPSGAGEADFRAAEVSFDAAGSRFLCLGPDGEAEVRMPLPGHFNVENALAAIGACHALGVPAEAAAGALASAGLVPGRFEPVDEGQPFAVLVDYAHTPDSLENALDGGAEADRGTADRGLRVRRRSRPREAPADGGDRGPALGRLRGHLGQPALRGAAGDHRRDPGWNARPRERRRSRWSPTAGPRSRCAFGAAAAGDTVVIAGKGHEQGQELAGGRKIPFDDREVAREELRKLARDRAVAQTG